MEGAQSLHGNEHGHARDPTGKVAASNACTLARSALAARVIATPMLAARSQAPGGGRQRAGLSPGQGCHGCAASRARRRTAPQRADRAGPQARYKNRLRWPLSRWRHRPPTPAPAPLPAGWRRSRAADRQDEPGSAECSRPYPQPQTPPDQSRPQLPCPADQRDARGQWRPRRRRAARQGVPAHSRPAWAVHGRICHRTVTKISPACHGAERPILQAQMMGEAGLRTRTERRVGPAVAMGFRIPAGVSWEPVMTRVCVA